MSVPLKVPCPACGTRNQVPADRLGDGPVCGRCREPLFPGKPLELDAAGFDLHATRSGLPLLVDFWAPWCGPCRMMAPHFEAAAAQLEPAARLAKVNTEAAPELGARFGIRSIPTMVMFREGREIARVSGALAAADIARWAKTHLAKEPS